MLGVGVDSDAIGFASAAGPVADVATLKQPFVDVFNGFKAKVAARAAEIQGMRTIRRVVRITATSVQMAPTVTSRLP